MEIAASESYRLSPVQLRMWECVSVDSLAPYVSSCTLLVTGPLDRDALERAAQAIVGRHESLRTTLRHAPELAVPLQVIDIAGSAIIEDMSVDEALRLLQIGMAATDRFRVLLARANSESEHVVVLMAPSLFVDLESLTRVAAEFVRAYGSLSNVPGEAELEGVTQHVVISEWLSQLALSKAGDEGRSFWQKNGMAGAASAGLPYATRVAAAPVSVERLDLDIDAAVVKRLVVIEKETGSTIEEMLAAIWSLWLWRVGNVGTFGWRFSGREYPDLRNSVGPLSRYLPAHADWTAGDTFLTGLERLRRWCLDARQWQECFEWAEAGGERAEGGAGAVGSRGDAVRGGGGAGVRGAVRAAAGGGAAGRDVADGIRVGSGAV